MPGTSRAHQQLRCDGVSESLLVLRFAPTALGHELAETRSSSLICGGRGYPSSEPEYVFSPSETVVRTGELPDGTRFARWMTPRMHPLPPGTHTVHEYVTLSVDSWDGLGVEPTLNLIPAGESQAGYVEFEVLKPD